MKDLKSFIQLNEAQRSEFYTIIKKYRKKYILTPYESAETVFEKQDKTITKYIHDKKISELIVFLREEAYSEYLISEKEFVKQVLIEINESVKLPMEQMNSLAETLSTLQRNSSEEYRKEIENLFGEYTSSIFPYIYELSLSNTQSRRSRAGKTFEAIIYKLYEQLKYPFDSQAKIGKNVFKAQNLGKIVDSILPSVKQFGQLRNKTIVGSMKTTLRERWQEVVEEVSRSNLPNIYLLTVDEVISESKVKQMSEHNIILVVLAHVKEQPKLSTYRNVISFEDYLFDEIPPIMKYWQINC